MPTVIELAKGTQRVLVNILPIPKLIVNRQAKINFNTLKQKREIKKYDMIKSV